MKYIEKKEPKPVPLPPVTHVVELTQDEVDFIASAATALGMQKFKLNAMETPFSSNYKIKDEYVRVAENLQVGLTEIRSNDTPFERMDGIHKVMDSEW